MSHSKFVIILFAAAALGCTQPPEDGVDGATGARGPQGPVGPQGADGLIGPVGDTGPQGPAGPQGLQGDVGPAGATGPQGPAGPQGPMGPAGPQGFNGAPGPAGPQGFNGATGPAGPQGPQGPQGVGVQGAQGVAGPQGPAGPRGAPGHYMAAYADGGVELPVLGINSSVVNTVIVSHVWTAETLMERAPGAPDLGLVARFTSTGTAAGLYAKVFVPMGGAYRPAVVYTLGGFPPGKVIYFGLPGSGPSNPAFVGRYVAVSSPGIPLPVTGTCNTATQMSGPSGDQIRRPVVECVSGGIPQPNPLGATRYELTGVVPWEYGPLNLGASVGL